VDALGVLAGAPLVASTLERDVLPARVRGYRPADLDELCAAGEVVWTGAGAIGGRDGRIRLCFADQLDVLAPGWPPSGEPLEGPLHQAVRRFLTEHGASFWGQLRAADAAATDTELLVALWDLVWAGEVTNDTLAPLRALLGSGGVARPPSSAARRTAARRPRPVRLTRLGPPAAAGRWSLLASMSGPGDRTSTEIAHARAIQLLERHGVVTREVAAAEGVVGGYAAVYPVLKVLEERGQARRGYFVVGLGGAQFALPGAVDRLRSHREPVTDIDDVRPLVLAATDPAQPYGSTLPWPSTSGRPTRNGSAIVVLEDGTPVVWFDRSSNHLVSFPAASGSGRWAAVLADLVASGRERSVEVRRVDGGPVPDDVAAALRSAGFVDGYRGLVRRA
ncbi:MAG: Lhr family helicase, partial [Ilumatobacteraceae bacterium]